MKKTIQYFMLITLIAAQTGGTFKGVTLLASEIQSDAYSQTITESEVSSETESEVSSETESEVSSETESEVSSETESEVSSETESEVSSETESEVSSETESEVSSETDSEISVDNVMAKITIDKDGGLQQQQAAVPQRLLNTDQLKENENITPYENELRLDADSGEATINVQLTSKSKSLSSDLKNQLVYFIINDKGELEAGSTKKPKSNDGNVITVLNGTIVDSDNAIVRTSGGYDATFYVYPTIEDLKSDTNGVPYSGGGFDGTFIESIEENGKYYTHVKISGYEGYTEAGNVQIVPEELIQAQSYYTEEDGNWAYYSAIDPLTSTDYDKMVVGTAPSAAQTGVKYYTNDDVNFYTEPILTDTAEKNPKISYNSYFMNLPFRSVSSYTATDYKNYLKSKGYTSSEYYNETSAFTKAQSLESVNSLMIFAMANHESAYGTSSYARACYNFFGRGAVDSDPDQACQYYNYNTATDGILAQTLFLQNGYFDILDWRYSGTHVGNKASGMNVKYASDSDWGKKISNHAYLMDQYMGGKEEDKYPIIKVSGVSHVYNNSALTDKVKSSGDSGSNNFYDLSQMTGTSNTINVVATRQTDNSYEIYPPTSIKNTSSTDCSYTSSRRGSYPNYEGRSKVNVDINTGNYSCDYGSYTNAKKWISKSNTSIINNRTVPYVNKNVYLYYPSGKTEYKFVLNASNDVIQYAYRYDENGHIITKYIYQPGTVYGDNHGQKLKTRLTIKLGKVTSAVTYNDAREPQYYYQYYNTATLASGNAPYNIRYRYNMDTDTGYIDSMFAYPNDQSRKATRIYTYQNRTTYANRANNILYKFKVKKGTTYLVQGARYTSAPNPYIDKVYNYNDGVKWRENSPNQFKTVFWLKNSNMEINYAIGYRNDQPYIKYTYDPGTIYGQDHGHHIKNRYYY